jgi:uroporphyrinogen decarboxylase
LKSENDMATEKKILKIAKGDLKENAVWFMRQAGRYLPRYQELKGNKRFAEMMRDRETIKRISLLPLEYLKTDAIVVFTDILLPYLTMGYEVDYENKLEVKKSRMDEFDYYRELSFAIADLQATHHEKTIIGVVGGPFTTYSYLNEKDKGGYAETKVNIASGDGKVLKNLTEEIIQFADIQARSGADVIQVFESWIGSVSENFYDNNLKRLESYFIEQIRNLGKPVIFFSEGSSHLYERLIKFHADVYSIDWRTSLSTFGKICGKCIVQGNLDPYLIGLDDERLKMEVRRIMDEGREFTGHIFNLGHGVPTWADYRKLNMISSEVLKYGE